MEMEFDLLKASFERCTLHCIATGTYPVGRRSYLYEIHAVRVDGPSSRQLSDADVDGKTLR